MRSWDGAALFYRQWLPDRKADKAIVLFHRGHEHSGRWQDTVDKLDLPDFAMFAWDARGHGRSPGKRGHADSLGCVVRDMDAFVRHICEEHGIDMENVIVLANSLGSVVAGVWLHDYAPAVRGIVMGSPAMRVRLFVPFAIPALRLLGKLRRRSFVRSYVKGKLLSRDPAKIAEYDSDPLVTPEISVNLLVGLHDAGTRLVADAGAITTPTLMLTAGSDWVVDRSVQRRFFAGLGSSDKQRETYPGFRHDIFNERENDRPIARARAFILDLFARPGQRPSLLAADRHGSTKAEYDDLRRPLPWYAPRRWQFAMSRLFLNTLGRMSDGIRIGLEAGFDSGAMLDYVYADRASGRTPVGRLIDRLYLNSIGWRGIRERRANLETVLDDAIERVRRSDRPARILDIAAGHGRYVLNALSQRPESSTTALLRDYCAANVAAGERSIQAMSLPGVKFEQGDAFDREALAAVRPRPTIGIVSGLYELFPDNEPIRTSLAGLAEAIEPGGYLIYTNQPWHPQLEFIARVLPSHREGAPWVMRRRSQAEMDALVRAAGFEKIATRADGFGIFTVSLAKRNADAPDA